MQVEDRRLCMTEEFELHVDDRELDGEGLFWKIGAEAHEVKGGHSVKCLLQKQVMAS